MEVGVDADGVGKGEWGDGGEVGEDDGGDVGEVDRVLFEDLGWRAVSGGSCKGRKNKGLRLSNGRHIGSTASLHLVAAP